jgi:hypothetical protein
MEHKFLTPLYSELKEKTARRKSYSREMRENFNLTVTYEWKGSGNKIEEVS